MNRPYKIKRLTVISPFAIRGVSCSTDSFEVAESSVLRTGISGKKSTHRKSAKRKQTPKQMTINPER